MTIAVFLADDHAVVRDGLRLLLEAQPNITVVGDAANGRDAVRQARILKPDVLVLDVAMAGLNGIEATHQIRVIRPSTQIVILSMHANPEYVARAFQAGALGYVLKEATGLEVTAAVQAVYAGKRYLSRKIAEMGYSDPRSYEENPLDCLSEREREVLQLTVEGRSSTQIADILALSPKTVETYRSRLMHKLELDDLPSLVKFAIRHGLTSLE
jgi:DNA-binding NarL/FixJ family response regulator